MARHTNRPLGKDLPARLIENIPTSKSIGEAMRKAGYSESTSRKNVGGTLDTALNVVAERALQGDQTSIDLLALTGITASQLWARYSEIALTSNQHGVALQALAPLLAQQGLKLNDKEEMNTAPPINIGIINTPPNAQNAPTTHEIPKDIETPT